MSEAICAVEACGTPVKHTTVCTPCCTDLEKTLGDIPALADELDVTITRQAVMTAKGDGGRKSRETPLAFHPAASEVRWVLRNTLTTWARELTGDDELPADTLADVARWLLARLDRIRVHPAGGKAVEEITSAVAAVERVIDRPPGWKFLAACDDCKTDLYARPWATWMSCKVCGREYDVAERKDAMREVIEDQLYHSVAMSDVLAGVGVTVTSSMIRGYAKRGRITAKTKDDEDRPLYRVGDVLDIVLGRGRHAAGESVA